MGDLVYQVETTESLESTFFAVVYRHQREGHAQRPWLFHEKFGQPMGHTEEATMEFDSWSRKRYKTTMPK